MLAWLERQPWYTGELGTSGASYLGYTQWAIAREAGTTLRAMAPGFVGSDAPRLIYPGDALSLEVFLFWTTMIHTQEQSLAAYFRHAVFGGKRIRTAAGHLPLQESDRLLFGRTYPFWQQWVRHDQPDDPWWEPGTTATSRT